jgi:hypothetical protein
VSRTAYHALRTTLLGGFIDTITQWVSTQQKISKMHCKEWIHATLSTHTSLKYTYSIRQQRHTIKNMNELTGGRYAIKAGINAVTPPFCAVIYAHPVTIASQPAHVADRITIFPAC